jgi:hypothetical protein
MAIIHLPRKSGDKMPQSIRGIFKIDFGVANDVDFYAAIPFFNLPCITASQAIDWYIYNQGTSQTIGVSWQLWITPMAFGPHA